MIYRKKSGVLTRKPSSVLLKTDLPLSPPARAAALLEPDISIKHNAAYWSEKTVGFDFSAEDRIDSDKFNRIVWQGTMTTPYPDAATSNTFIAL